MAYFIGLDLGGTNLKAGMLDQDAKILCKFSVPTEAAEGPDHVIDVMKEMGNDAVPLLAKGIRSSNIYLQANACDTINEMLLRRKTFDITDALLGSLRWLLQQKDTHKDVRRTAQRSLDWLSALREQRREKAETEK